MQNFLKITYIQQKITIYTISNPQRMYSWPGYRFSNIFANTYKFGQIRHATLTFIYLIFLMHINTSSNFTQFQFVSKINGAFISIQISSEQYWLLINNQLTSISRIITGSSPPKNQNDCTKYIFSI